MTGPEHYREAENLLGFVAEESGHTMANVRNALAGAQVHATLALAAATALNDNESTPSSCTTEGVESLATGRRDT